MPSLWAETLAVFSKEMRSEWRSRQGFLAGGLFSVVAVVAMAFAGINGRPTPTLQAGMFTVVLLFAACITLPRVFLVEDEQRTIDLLRLLARPEAAFLGKFGACKLQILVTAAILASFYILLSGASVASPIMLIAALALESVTLAATLSIVGVLVSGARNRWVLAAAVGLPLLLPQATLSIGALRFAFGEGSQTSALQNLGGLGLFAIAMISFGPVLANAMWRLERG
ncbi:MAG: heme exporter protein CcmB [Chthonomonas sp.]|nr:heme exporter protein CcmB [Chthonomonas sp.]